jgi:ATP-dependent Clp protease ATP-binding subunit ClpA
MSNKASESRQEVIPTIHRSAELAQEHGHDSVTLEHLLVALLENEDVRTVIETIGNDITGLDESLDEFLNGPFIEVTRTVPHPTKSFDEVVTRCVGSAIFSSNRVARPVDLLVHLLQHPAEDSFAVTALNQHGLTALAVKRHLSHGVGAPPSSTGSGSMEDGVTLGGNAPAKDITTREEAEKFLEKYCINLNKTAADAKIDPLIGRAEEVGSIIQIVSRRTKNNIALVGEPGVGKTAIAEGLALKIIRKEVPKAIADAVVYSLEIGNLVAGTRFRGDFEERMKQVLQALELIPDAILFIDEIHTIMGAGAGSSGSLDVANLLKPALAKGKLRCIGATTLEEYRKHFEKDRALLRRFKKVDVNEPGVADAKLILRGLAENYEKFHGVTYTKAALDAAVDLTHRYVANAFLPDKAIDIIDNAGARQRVADEKTRKKVIDITEIEFEVSKVAKIPAQTVAEDETAKLGRLADDLRANVFEQEAAIIALTNAVLIARSGLREPNKPQGSYLFVGPTGVGKTEAAKQLSATLGVPLFRYDMSEYMEKHSVAKLIGAPPGYVGFGEGGAGNGKLTNDVDTHPYCVLLLDEIEKAHPDVFNILLQVMDDGRLTNSAGKTVHFNNVILIMTSNAGARDALKNRIGFGSQDNSDGDTKVINETFTPEFRNRLDAIVRFGRLSPAGIEKVVDKFLEALKTQAAERSVKLTFTKEAKALLAKKGFDPHMGARPLARVITDLIKTPLSREMILGKLKGGGRAKVSVNKAGEVVLT